jgi:hypothetical protein
MSADAGASRRILSTLYYPRRPAWTERVAALDPAALSAPAVIRRLLREAPLCDAMMLDGASHRDQLAALLLLARRKRPPLVFADTTWGLSGPLVDRVISRAAARMLNRRDVYFCVLSKYECESLPRVWGFDPARVFFTPFYATLTDEELSNPAFDGEGVFAGGDSLRDYASLIEAARALPVPFTLATGLLSPAQVRGLPPNVSAGRTSHDEFMSRLRAASVVVVPFEPGIERSAGQQTYLNAMALGKIAIVTDGPGVREYIEDGATGLIVDPCDPAELAEAIRWATDPAHEAEQRAIRERGRTAVLERFTASHYVDALLGVLDRVLGGRGTSSSAA